MEKLCVVINKSAGSVVYPIPELGIRRSFAPRERKTDISEKELFKLVQMPGGLELFYNYLQVEDQALLRRLINGEEQPEYWLKESEIPTWMNSCSLDEFKDALDFAPEGTKDLIKSFAVSMPLNDYSKRQAIKDQLGFDVTVAITNSGEEEAAPAATQTSRRTTSSVKAPEVVTSADSTPIVEEEKPQRRVITTN